MLLTFQTKFWKDGNNAIENQKFFSTNIQAGLIPMISSFTLQKNQIQSTSIRTGRPEKIFTDSSDKTKKKENQ